MSSTEKEKRRGLSEAAERYVALEAGEVMDLIETEKALKELNELFQEELRA